MVNVKHFIDNTMDVEYKLNPSCILTDMQTTNLFIALENQIWSVLFTLTRMVKI